MEIRRSTATAFVTMAFVAGSLVGGAYVYGSQQEESERLRIEYEEATAEAQAMAVEHLQARNLASTEWFAIENRTADLDAREEELGIYNDWLTDEADRLEVRLRPVPGDLALQVLETCGQFKFQEGEVLIESTAHLIGYAIGQIDNVRNLMICMEYEGGEWFNHSWMYLDDAVSALAMAQSWVIQEESDVGG